MLKKFHSADFVEPYPKLPTIGSTMLETEFLEDLVRALEGKTEDWRPGIFPSAAFVVRFGGVTPLSLKAASGFRLGTL
jgi:hypothetical protein